MKKFTVFARFPDSDIDDPVYYSRVRALDCAGAVAEAVRVYGVDAIAAGAYDAKDAPGVESFKIVAVIEGWPKFTLGEGIRS